jgi:hypothetical protein
MSESPVATTKTEQPKVCASRNHIFRHSATEEKLFFWGIKQAVIKAADMSEKLQQAAVDIASDALEKWNIEKDVR